LTDRSADHFKLVLGIAIMDNHDWARPAFPDAINLTAEKR